VSAAPGIGSDPDRTWLTLPDLVELLGAPTGKVRRMLEERSLLGIRIDGVVKVPADFIVDGEPLGDLRGTVIVLGDSGFSDEEAMHWLLTHEESLGTTPIAALRSGRKAEVRRVAQSLAF